MNDDHVRGLARLVSAAGLAGVASGAMAWLVVRSQLADERIVVAGSAPHLAGHAVRGPLTAFEQANAIKQTALGATGGRTYGELEADDPNAAMAKDASLLRASLFTSILSFGMAALQAAVGAVLLVIGAALRRVSDRDPFD
jgi:hypothetical protein